MGNYLDVLSELVAKTSYEDFSEEAVTAVKDVTLDTIGAMIAGNRLAENLEFAKLASERSYPKTATMFGLDLKAEPMMANLVNATSGVALEMDEGNRFGGGHPGIHVLPGAIAVAEEMGASGQQVIESILLGYEISSRIGGATRPRPHVHSHGHWGTFGTAAAVAKLWDFDAESIRAVINLASSMSPANSWTPAFKGKTVRNLYSGRSGFQGILAAHLYKCGFTGLDDGPSDIFGLILGQSFDPELAIKDMPGEYRIQMNYFKFYACCRINHPSLEAVLAARSRDDFPVENVSEVEVQVPREILEGMLGEYPSTMLGAKFNVPYAVSAAVVKGSGDVNSFYPDSIVDDRIRQMSGKVKLSVDPGMANVPDGPLAKATIRLKDGQIMEGTAGSVVKGDYGNRVPREDVVSKFHFLTDHLVGESKANDIVNAIDRLEKFGDIRELTSLLNA
jgi:2-methylcitrate dehydratase PrpD